MTEEDPLPPDTGTTRPTRERGWTSTASQGYILARWAAAELAAARVEGLRPVAGLVVAMGVAVGLLGIPFDPTWAFLAVAVALVVVGVGAACVLTAAAWILRRLALPRRARHLRAEVARSRALLLDAVGRTGFPVSLTGAIRFVLDLARGRRPHSGVAKRMVGLGSELSRVAELDHLRAALAEAATRR